MNTSRRAFLWKALGISSLAPALGQCTYDHLPPLLELLSPNGGELFSPFAGMMIRWNAIDTGNLLIEFSSNGGALWTKIAENVPAESGNFEWTLPRRNSNQCLIRISDESNPELKDESDTFFSVFETYVIKFSEHPELQQTNGFKILTESPFGGLAILRLNEDSFKVFSLSCTHLGCTVEWMENNKIFSCPCHGSSFSKEGCLLGGPAQQALWVYEYKLDAAINELTIYNRLKVDAC
ncbi:MAG: Rieske 2Fe-2S domain-containing protein [Saprospiraceae bacterium]|nr:Rieske 2Fe-2S domain-containing protein [Saprospiraceae bacterium]